MRRSHGARARIAQAVLTPKALALESRRRLAAAADPGVARASRAYFKGHESVTFYGLKSATLRSIERELWSRGAERWTLREAVEYCERMLREPQLEAKGLGVLALARHRRAFVAGLLTRTKAWLAADRCANWATTDALCSLVISELLRRFPDRVGILRGWTRSRNLWVRRAAAVSLTPLARKGEALDAAYGVVTALRSDEQDLIHKATGWLLREAGKTDASRLERYLLEQGPRLPRTTLRYAIERFPPAARQRLLAQTRP